MIITLKEPVFSLHINGVKVSVYKDYEKAKEVCNNLFKMLLDIEPKNLISIYIRKITFDTRSRVNSDDVIYCLEVKGIK